MSIAGYLILTFGAFMLVKFTFYPIPEQYQMFIKLGWALFTGSMIMLIVRGM